ncbi:GNAT family N-acetyltransferase [Thiomicrorhabdus sediminis]|nr:GNAT family N-acetyltransferase [Thiomicrorhabdus sediminis]
MELVLATQTTHFKSLENLARQIWTEHYCAIIGQQQVDYMLDKFQSADAIAEQSQQGRAYYLLMGAADNPATAAGYLAYDLADSDSDSGKPQLFLSKLYIHSDFRGQGLAKQALQAVIDQHPNRDILLTVNKKNHIAINFYLAQGFIKNREVVADIGNGYVMDDYEMLKTTN